MKVTVGVLVLTLCAGAAAAQTKAKTAPAPAAATDKAAIEKALIANEEKINNAVTKADAATFQSLVAADSTGIDPMGPQSMADFLKMLKPGVSKMTDVKLDSFKVMWVDSNTAIVTYTWTGKGTFMDMPVQSPSFASTVYNKRGAKWVAVFHQETPKAAMPPAMKK
jgi:uncharacterized protein DUF4440